MQNFDYTEEEYSGYKDIPVDEQKTEKTDGTEKRVVQTGTEAMSGEKSGSKRKMVRKPTEISDEDVNQTIKTAKTLNPVKYIHRAKVSFYDFAGQEIFHASHPTFLSPKSIFTLVFDLNIMYRQKDDKLTKKYERAKFFGDCRGGSTLGNIGKLHK